MHYKFAILAVMVAAASAQMNMPGMDTQMTADDPTQLTPTVKPPPPVARAKDSPKKKETLPQLPKIDNTTLNGQCKEIHDLTKFTKFAANETQVQMAAEKMNATAEQIIQFEANATIARDELKHVKANKTVVETCAKVDRVHGECNELDKLNKLEKLVHNDTMLAEYQAKKNLTDTQITQLKAQAAKEHDKLDAMNKNTTLLAECKSLKENEKEGMNPVDAALKATNTSLSPPTNVQGQNAPRAVSTTVAKSAASAVIGSSFLAVLMASVIVLLT